MGRDREERPWGEIERSDLCVNTSREGIKDSDRMSAC